MGKKVCELFPGDVFSHARIWTYSFRSGHQGAHVQKETDLLFCFVLLLSVFKLLRIMETVRKEKGKKNPET